MKRKLLIGLAAAILLLCICVALVPGQTPEDTTPASSSTADTSSQTQHTDAADITEPTDATEETTEPTDPGEPTDPTESTAATQPSDVTEPTQSTETTGTTVTTAPTQPPTQPPTEPVTEPVNTVPPDTLQVISLEMTKRYGDCTLIKFNDFEILVDGGEKGEENNVKALLQSYVTDGVLELFIGTHAHSDHIGGVSYTSTFSPLDEIEMIIDCGGSEMNKTQVWASYKEVVSHFVSLGTEYYTISDVIGTDLQTIEIADGVTLYFLQSQYYGKKSANVNDTSIGFYIQYGDTYLCMFGDAESDAEASFVALNEKFTSSSDTVIFKADHHGSAGANTEAILSWVEPDYCFISSAIVKTGNAADLTQHPYYEAVSRIAGYTEDIYWNGINGTLHINISEAGAVEIYGEGRTRSYKYGGSTVSAASEKDSTYLHSKWYQTGVDKEGWKVY